MDDLSVARGRRMNEQERYPETLEEMMDELAFIIRERKFTRIAFVAVRDDGDDRQTILTRRVNLAGLMLMGALMEWIGAIQRAGSPATTYPEPEDPAS